MKQMAEVTATELAEAIEANRRGVEIMRAIDPEMARMVEVLLPPAERELARLRAQATPPGECTGFAASWCPIHGDCSCPRWDDGEIKDDREPEVACAMRLCALHGEHSPHAEPPEAHAEPPSDSLAELAECFVLDTDGLEVAVASIETYLSDRLVDETAKLYAREVVSAARKEVGRRRLLDMEVSRTPLSIIAAHLEHNEPLCDAPECVGCPQVRAALNALATEIAEKTARVAELEGIEERVTTIVNEEVGIQPVTPPHELLTLLERHHGEQRRRIAELESSLAEADRELELYHPDRSGGRSG